MYKNRWSIVSHVFGSLTFIVLSAAHQNAIAATPISKVFGLFGEFSGPSVPAIHSISSDVVLASNYLTTTCGPSGRFGYRISTLRGTESNSYNVIRHAGAMYALAMSFQLHPNPSIASALVRSAQYLRENYIGPGLRPGELVVWSKSKYQLSDAELGATGLGLAALAEANQVKPGTVPLADLEALGRFALSLQKEDGGFYSKYRPESGPVLEWESLYYPGEAALGFVELYEQDHSKEWLIAASKALSYLARSRGGLVNVPTDHWALIAAAKLLPYCDHSACPVSREELVHYATRICDSIISEQIRAPGSLLDGAFDPTGLTAPVATRVEGLLAALEFLPKDESSLRVRIQEAATRGVSFLIRAQIKTGPYAGGMPRAIAAGARGASEIRIDYVQHALCAWLRYEKLFPGK